MIFAIDMKMKRVYRHDLTYYCIGDKKGTELWRVMINEYRGYNSISPMYYYDNFMALFTNVGFRTIYSDQHDILRIFNAVSVISFIAEHVDFFEKMVGTLQRDTEYSFLLESFDVDSPPDDWFKNINYPDPEDFYNTLIRWVVDDVRIGTLEDAFEDQELEETFYDTIMTDFIDPIWFNVYKDHKQMDCTMIQLYIKLKYSSYVFPLSMSVEREKYDFIIEHASDLVDYILAGTKKHAVAKTQYVYPEGKYTLIRLNDKI